MKRRYKIRLKEERVLLSDVLPYETPISFSNSEFCKYVVNKNKDFQGCSPSEISAIKKWETIIAGLTDSSYIPFDFYIKHKKNEFRKLSICHPKSQMDIVDFYKKYKSLIIYYCSISPYSLRKPIKEAKLYNYRDLYFKRNISETNAVAQYNEEYESLRSFFIYKKYNNIYKFYDSYEFNRCEKKFSNLLKFDISKCFDSIYTHSISWAIEKKENTKSHLSPKLKSFSKNFDKLMQNLNYKETCGIIIGPEFSRIFAEIILQSIDLNVYIELKGNGLIHKKDYEVFRYVDDYFVFFNETSVKDKIFNLFQVKLKEFKLSINSQKTEEYQTPIITNISIAKSKTINLLKYLDAPTDSENPITDRSKIRTNKLICDTKILLKESNVMYAEIANFLLSMTDRKIKYIMNDFDMLLKKFKEEKNENEIDKLHSNLKSILLKTLDYLFFVYLMEPKVNSTIIIATTIQRILTNLKKNKVPKSLTDNIKKCISDNIELCLKKNSCDDFIQIETLYLLVSIEDLGRDYFLSEETLKKYFKLDSNGFKIKLNYFSITVLLLYIKNKERYSFIKTKIIKKIEEYFNSNNKDFHRKTETILLLMDLIKCPYIENTLKRNILKNVLFPSKPTESELNFWIKNCPFHFTKWENLNLAKELDLKRNKSVY